MLHKNLLINSNVKRLNRIGRLKEQIRSIDKEISQSGNTFGMKDIKKEKVKKYRYLKKIYDTVRTKILISK